MNQSTHSGIDAYLQRRERKEDVSTEPSEIKRRGKDGHDRDQRDFANDFDAGHDESAANETKCQGHKRAGYPALVPKAELNEDDSFGLDAHDEA